MTVKAGWKSTEHWQAVRAEILGFVLVVIGLAAKDVWLVAIGAVVVIAIFCAYAGSRGEVKAAAVRRPVDQAPVKVI